MKSLKIVFCASLIIAFPLVAMELPKGTKKRAAEEIEEEKPAKVQAIEESEKSAFERLPIELQTHILSFLTTARGKTKEARLNAATENIRNFMSLSKAFQPLLNDEKIADYLIHELAKNYIAANRNKIQESDLIDAALALQTIGAGRWLKAQSFRRTIITYLGVALLRELFQVVEKNNLAKAGFILSYVPELVNRPRMEYGQPGMLSGDERLLFVAIDKKNVPMIELLLKVPGVDTNVTDQCGNGLILLAIWTNDLAVFEKVLTAPGINVNHKNNKGHSPFFAIMNDDDLDKIAFLRALLNAPGVDVNIRNKYNSTPLIYAVDARLIDEIKILLNNPGVDVNLQNARGQTALIEAVHNSIPVLTTDNLKMVETLLSNPNINVNIADNNGITALALARNTQDTAQSHAVRALIIKMLMEHGAEEPPAGH